MAAATYTITLTRRSIAWMILRAGVYATRGWPLGLRARALALVLWHVAGVLLGRGEP